MGWGRVGKSLRKAAHRATRGIRKVNRAVYKPILEGNPVARKLKLNKRIKRLGRKGAKYVVKPVLTTAGAVVGGVFGGPPGAAAGGAAGGALGSLIHDKIGTKSRKYNRKGAWKSAAIGAVAGYAGASAYGSFAEQGVTLSSIGGALSTARGALGQANTAKALIEQRFAEGGGGATAGQLDTIEDGGSSSVLPLVAIGVVVFLILGSSRGK